MSESERTMSAPVSDAPEVDGPLDDLSGKTLGDFRVERLLGRGGMGEVYLARQISLNRPVALKVLRAEMLSRPTYLARFEAEATAVAKLSHPNIVHVYTLGCVDGVRFIAMEYVPGTNLRDYILKKGALDVALALSFMRQAGAAISAAGEKGLIHRDLKPENLLLTKKGQVKVADFGLCRDLGTDTRYTQAGITLGTPQYMSPEQAQGHALDHRSDLYSLGVTFYHMLAGVPPFRGETPLAIALKHVKDTPVSLSVHRPDLPPELVALVMKLIAKDPNDRYQSAAEMLRDLAKVRETLQMSSVAVPQSDLAPGTAATVTTATATATESETGSAPNVGTGLAAILSGAIARVSIRSLTGPRGGRALAALIGLCLALGLAWGWLTRPPDLLSGSAPPPDGAVPALWMAPQWADIPRRASAEEQYRYALLHATADLQEAAWLAVPGYFPAQRDWAVLAYIQLGRSLLRHRDAERLQVLAAEVARWGPDDSKERKLAHVLRAGAKALEGKLEDVLDTMTPLVSPPSLYDPALLELSFAVTVRAATSADDGADSYALSRLRTIQGQLLGQLYTAEWQELVGGWRRAR